ncbi:MAG: hypothetical protein AAGH79_08515 [Bacteroidota bacterium]
MNEEVKEAEYEMLNLYIDSIEHAYEAVVRHKATEKTATLVGRLPNEIHLDKILEGHIVYLDGPPGEVAKINAESSDTRTVSAEDYEFLQEMKAMAAKKYILVPMETVDLIAKSPYKYLDKILNKE